MAYVEAGPADGPVALLLHGEPTWSFLYRHVMRVLADAGVRAVAPDLVGFGRSDKPAAIADHSYARHVEWTRALVLDHLDLRDVTLVGQDWGGLIGLRLVAEHPDRFARVVAANTGLPTGDQDMPEVWWEFRRAVEKAPVLDVGRLVASGCARGLDAGGPGGVRRAVPRRGVEGRAAGDAAAGADPARRPGHRGQPRRVGGAGALGPAVPHRVQRRRPDHRRDGADPAQAGARRRRPRAPRGRRRRALPAGGRRRRSSAGSSRRSWAGDARATGGSGRECRCDSRSRLARSVDDRTPPPCRGLRARRPAAARRRRRLADVGRPGRGARPRPPRGPLRPAGLRPDPARARGVLLRRAGRPRPARRARRRALHRGRRVVRRLGRPAGGLGGARVGSSGWCCSRRWPRWSRRTRGCGPSGARRTPWSRPATSTRPPRSTWRRSWARTPPTTPASC